MWAGSSREQLPSTPQVREAVLALKSLRESYVAIFGPGKKHGRRWKRCLDAHEKAVQTLEDKDLAAIVDERVGRLHDAGNGSPEKALKVLNETFKGRGPLEKLERRLARGAGFDDDELRKFLRQARRCLKQSDRKTPLPHVVDTKGLVQHLLDVHQHAGEVLFDPRRKRRMKDSERNLIGEQIEGRLYMVISVVTNSDHASVFNTSYACGLGAAGAKGLHRKGLPARHRTLPAGIPTPAV